MDWFGRYGEWIHRTSILVDSWLQCLDFNSIESWVEYKLAQNIDSLDKELGLEREGELCELSANVNFELATNTLDQLFDLVFWVFASASACTMSNEIGNWAISDILLSATSLDQNSDSYLLYFYPVCPPTQLSEATLT